MGLAAMKERDVDTGNRAILTELACIRTSQSSIAKAVDQLDRKINGNGTAGIGHRLTIIETHLSTKKSTTSFFLSTALALLAILVAAAALFVAES